MLLIGTGDPKQLKPPSGSLLWMSPLNLTTFRLYALTEFVRTDRSGDGQKALRLMSEAQSTEQAANEIAQVLPESCNFVDDWNL